MQKAENKIEDSLSVHGVKFETARLLTGVQRTTLLISHLEDNASVLILC